MGKRGRKRRMMMEMRGRRRRRERKKDDEGNYYVLHITDIICRLNCYALCSFQYNSMAVRGII